MEDPISIQIPTFSCIYAHSEGAGRLKNLMWPWGSWIAASQHSRDSQGRDKKGGRQNDMGRRARGDIGERTDCFQAIYSRCFKLPSDTFE
jgi:hypothetical protein